MAEEDGATFAYFGVSTTPQMIEDVFLKTFERPAKRSENRWEIRLSNGKIISVSQHGEGVRKFCELFLGHEGDLKRLDELLADNLLAESTMQREPSELKTWLQFSISADNDLQGFADLKTLKDNFLKVEGGIAYEYDNAEVTLRHPCGGIFGEYLC